MAEGISDMTKNKKREIKTRNARIWLDENGIIRVVYSANSEETLEDAEAHFTAITEISGSKRRPCLIDSGLHKSTSRDARMYYSRKAPEIAAAIAVLHTSPVAAVLINFMTGLNGTIHKEKFPIKLFTTENQAIEWLKEYIV